MRNNNGNNEKIAFWMKDDGKKCPICNGKLGYCHLGSYCTAIDCEGDYCDGIARLNREQIERFKDKIIAPYRRFNKINK